MLWKTPLSNGRECRLCLCHPCDTGHFGDPQSDAAYPPGMPVSSGHCVVLHLPDSYCLPFFMTKLISKSLALKPFLCVVFVHVYGTNESKNVIDSRRSSYLTTNGLLDNLHEMRHRSHLSFYEVDRYSYAFIGILAHVGLLPGRGGF